MIGKARVAGGRPRAGTELGSGSDEDWTHSVPQKKEEWLVAV
ncbi:hypothetical protein [Novosphingobium sp. ZW T3_23]